MALRFFLALTILFSTSLAFAQRTVTFALPDSSTQIQADLYGKGTRGVILAHGGRFNKQSWQKQAGVLANSGFLVLALGFRGDTFNADGSPSSIVSIPDNAADVLAAATYLRRIGAKTVFAVGGSFGGDAVGEANTRAPNLISRVVFLGSSGGDAPEKLNGRKLFIVARDDTSGDGPRLPGISDHYARAHDPKKLVILDGSAHAQFIFGTPQGPRLMNEILRFLSAP